MLENGDIGKMQLLPASASHRIDLALRLCYAMAFGVFFFNAYQKYLVDHKHAIRLALFLFSRALSLIFLVFARFPKCENRSLLISAVTFMSIFYYSFFSFDPGKTLLPDWIGFILQWSGFTLSLMTRAWLGRSFGLWPANRGVVTGGPYRLVRHPMYLGGLISDMGYFGCEFSWYNLVLYLIWYMLLFWRVVEEEKVLRDDAEYRNYMERVRFRMVPFVF